MPLKRTSEFQSTRLSRASTCRLLPYRNLPDISIHKALTSLDRILDDRKKILGNFNPQGSHEPRPMSGRNIPAINNFNPQGSHEPRLFNALPRLIKWHFNPQGSHEPRQQLLLEVMQGKWISIHKALTSLDSKNTQLSLHPCQIYIS